MTTILPGSVSAKFRRIVCQEFQVQKKENIIIVLCSGPSQNDITNFARRRNTTRFYCLARGPIDSQLLSSTKIFSKMRNICT